MAEESFAVTLTREEGYRFRADFDDPSFAPLVLDEPPPLGEGIGPNAARILAAAVGNCLSASLQFCLARAHVPTEGLATRVEGTLQRNGEGRFRIGELRVVLEPRLEDESHAGLMRCMDLFENFCTVTESVRAGIDVLVEVRPRAPAEDHGRPQEVAAPLGAGD